MHHDPFDIGWQDIGSGWQECVCILKQGDTAWHPASTSRYLHGPGKVTYRRAPSGSIEGIEEDA